MLTRREQLAEALTNIQTGTDKARVLKDRAEDPEVAELAKAVYALTDWGRMNDLDL
ncbi:hypothetical protein [Actinobaculum sp. 352]|uniref:hypothetical protein n=1 Tax=Actinobaculum sp. 352 TaxID=2490946 RepID=UPI0013E016E7|nr:hypothetical protein [Actinobaculum sp. 352]